MTIVVFGVTSREIQHASQATNDFLRKCIAVALLPSARAAAMHHICRAHKRVGRDGGADHPARNFSATPAEWYFWGTVISEAQKSASEVVVFLPAEVENSILP